MARSLSSSHHPRFAHCLSVVLALVCSLLMPAAVAWPQDVTGRLRSGDVEGARRAAERLAGEARDDALAEIAVAQASSGNLSGASATIRDIQSGSARAEAIQGGGGGSFADFQSLMDLIQRTVVPDTWEALGGPSTMAPYPGGIHVDPAGTVQEREPTADPEMVAEIQMLLQRPAEAPAGISPPDAAAAVADPAAWRAPSALRCVSLRRLLGEIVRQQHAGRRFPPELRYLAGLSTIQYVFLSEEDIVLAGSVGGIERHGDWFRDRKTGLVPISTEGLAVCLASALDGRAFGCTIDPAPAGLKQAAKVAGQISRQEIPLGRAADTLASALGRQQVTIFGTAGDTATGHLMLEADRHMKQLALGQVAMPEGVRNYLDVVGAAVDRGLPDDLLLRLWFAAAPVEVRCDRDKMIFEMAGRPLRLSGENQRAGADGRRGVAAVDIRTEQFVDEFNRNWMAIRSRYPIYAALESLYRGASVAELLNRHATQPAQRGLVTALVLIAGDQPSGLRTPKQVDSIAVKHTVRRAQKRHHMLVASGGVSISPDRLLRDSPRSYPPLEQLAPRVNDASEAAPHWWWDLGSR